MCITKVQQHATRVHPHETAWAITQSFLEKYHNKVIKQIFDRQLHLRPLYTVNTVASCK